MREPKLHWAVDYGRPGSDRTAIAVGCSSCGMLECETLEPPTTEAEARRVARRLAKRLIQDHELNGCNPKARGGPDSVDLSKSFRDAPDIREVP